MLRVTVDLETRSQADLKVVGAWEYSKHPTTEIICFAYKIEDSPTEIFYPLWGEEVPEDLEEALREEDLVLVAHNAFFEQSMLSNCFNRLDYFDVFNWNPSRWRCTAAKARSHSIPGSLEKASQALGLPVEKDLVGHKLMLKMCKPLPKYKKKLAAGKDPGPMFHETIEDILRLGEYCKTDVDVEFMVDNLLPDLSPYEKKVWELDQRMNSNGVHTDTKACATILQMIDAENLRLKDEVQDITFGIVENATQRAEVLQFVRSEGLDLPNLQARTIKGALEKGDIPDIVRQVLEIRQTVSKTSTAKYKRFLQRAGSDSRVRDLLVYHGPSTGRWAGAGIQPQNFPRGLISNTAEAIELILKGDIETIREWYGDPMIVFSSVLRGMITATPGKVITAADYNAIETRVLWWLADHQFGLDIFRLGGDPYKIQAASIFKMQAEDVKKDSDERWLGKKVILGSGYGLGYKKFCKSCHDEGANHVTLDLSKTAIESYRRDHEPVVKLWSLYEQGAIFAVLNPTKTVRVKKVKFFMSPLSDFLYCELPSGRRLAYPYPTIKGTKTPWGETKPTLFYWGVDSFTRKWKEESTYGGKLTENITQAVARDIMVHGMFNVANAGAELLLTVHDELVAEHEPGLLSVHEFEELITDLPDWADGCPITAEGWQGLRYKK